MKLFFVTSGDVAGGELKRTMGMAPHLAENGHQVTIVAEHCDANLDRLRALDLVASGDIDVVTFPPMGVNKERRWKAAYLGSETFDVAVLCGLMARNLTFGGRRFRSAPGVRIVVDHNELRSAARERSWAHRVVAQFVERAFTWRADGVLAVSELLASRHLRRRSTLRVLYAPFASEVPPEPEAQRTAAHRRQLGDHAIVYLGSIVEPYGVFDILEAFADLARCRDDVRLVMVGSGADLAGLRERAVTLGVDRRCEMLGFVADEEDVWSILRCARVLVGPMNNTVRDRARCPSKLFMYAAADRPIVTSNIGEAQLFSEVAHIYRHGDVADLTRAMAEAIDEPKRASAEFIRELYWDRRSDDFLDWLDDWSPGLTGEFG